VRETESVDRIQRDTERYRETGTVALCLCSREYGTTSRGKNLYSRREATRINCMSLLPRYCSWMSNDDNVYYCNAVGGGGGGVYYQR